MKGKQKRRSYVPLNDEGADDDGLVNISHGVPQPHKNNAWFRKYKLLFTIIGFLLVVVFVLAITLKPVLGRRSRTGLSYMKFSREIKKIERLRKTNPDAANDTWNCLPNQNGLVYLDREREGLDHYGLPSGDGNRNLYGIGWMHQMYCLALFRNSLYSFLYEGSASPWGGFTRQDSLESPGFQAHIDDCFDYLRQKILCAGDMTIEGAADISNKDPLGGTHHIDGFGETVTCINKLELGQWAEGRPPPSVLNYPGYGKYLKPPKSH